MAYNKNCLSYQCNNLSTLTQLRKFTDYVFVIIWPWAKLKSTLQSSIKGNKHHKPKWAVLCITKFPAEFQINVFVSQSGLDRHGYFLKYEREKNRFSFKSQYSCPPYGKPAEPHLILLMMNLEAVWEGGNTGDIGQKTWPLTGIERPSLSLGSFCSRAAPQVPTAHPDLLCSVSFCGRKVVWRFG